MAYINEKVNSISETSNIKNILDKFFKKTIYSNNLFCCAEDGKMKQANLIIILIGVICFIMSFIFMMPWDLYIKPLFQILLVVGIILVGTGLYLEEKEKKK